MLCRSALYLAATLLIAVHSGKCYGQRVFPDKAPQGVALDLKQAFESVKKLLGVEGAVVLQNGTAADGVSAPAGTFELQENVIKLADAEKQHKQWTVEAISEHVAKTSTEGQSGAFVHSRRLRQIPAGPTAG